MLQGQGQESATDYDDDWDNEDWGAIEDSNQASTSNYPSSSGNKLADSNSFGSFSTSSGLPRATTTNATDGWDTWPIEETVSSFRIFIYI